MLEMRRPTRDGERMRESGMAVALASGNGFFRINPRRTRWTCLDISHSREQDLGKCWVSISALALLFLTYGAECAYWSFPIVSITHL